MDLTLYCAKEPGTAITQEWLNSCARQINLEFKPLWLILGVIIFIFLSIQILGIYLTTKKKGTAFYIFVVVLDILLFITILLAITFMPDLLVNLGIIK
jgi:hypothetical protein